MKKTASTIEASKSLQAANCSAKRPRRGKDKKSRKMNPGSLLAIKRFEWPKGHSGNPGGLPGTDRAAQIARQIFENNPEAIYQAMARQIIEKGSAYAFATVADRAYGRPDQRTKFEVNHTVKIRPIEEIHAEIDRLIAERNAFLGRSESKPPGGSTPN
jgi:hypothetical protein